MDWNKDGLDYTVNAWEQLYDVVDNSYFFEKDSELIFQALKNQVRFLSFGEFLKRYLYKAAQLQEPFEDVPLETYQQIIKDSFADNATPKSFGETTAKLSALSKNWLTQRTVNRKVVFLLGFGLAMSVDDVNEFLQKALREQGINPKDPFEVICWYCYKNHYTFPKYESLWATYLQTPANEVDMKLLFSDRTIRYREGMGTIENDAILISFLSGLKTKDNKSGFSVTARESFLELYDQSRDLVAKLLNEPDASEDGKSPGMKQYRREDITPADLEHVISAAIPINKQGNLAPGKASSLNDSFDGKRFSRQRLTDILSGAMDVNRFDLITLCFFVYSQRLDDFANSKGRYITFVDEMNCILRNCDMGELYVAHPYECFVLMCILSEDPLGTYADVWELSYLNQQEKQPDMRG